MHLASSAASAPKPILTTWVALCFLGKSEIGEIVEVAVPPTTPARLVLRAIEDKLRKDYEAGGVVSHFRKLYNPLIQEPTKLYSPLYFSQNAMYSEDLGRWVIGEGS